MATKTKEKEKGTRPSYGISGENFVIIWNTSRSVRDVQEKLSKLAGREVALQAIQTRAVVYRNKHKIAMKKFSRTGIRLNQELFNDLGSQAQHLDEATRAEIDRRINEQGANAQFSDLFVKKEKGNNRKLATVGK